MHAGVQNVTTNTSTATNSFAIVAATSYGTGFATTEMVADALGTAHGRVGGYFGAYTNQPLWLTTANQVGIAADPSNTPAMLTIVAGTSNQNLRLSIQALTSAA